MWHYKVDLYAHRRWDQQPGSRNDAQRRIISAQSDKVLEDHSLHMTNFQADI